MSCTAIEMLGVKVRLFRKTIKFSLSYANLTTSTEKVAHAHLKRVKTQGE